MVAPETRYCDVRNLTETLAAPLGPEDQTVQSMPDVSPTKWHRAHVTWFFEEFLLAPNLRGYERFHPAYQYLFNSYYEAVGPRHPRAERGAVSRPTVEDVSRYRRAVDAAMIELLSSADDPDVRSLVELGLHHEQQHQELLLMDIKHVLSQSCLDPAYRDLDVAEAGASRPLSWIGHDGGLVEIGAEGHGFAFDNEGPRHEVHLQPFEIADRPVTCGEWLAFVDDGGYERPDLWLSDGWAAVCSGAIRRPLYWRDEGEGSWSVFTLGGRRRIDPAEPVSHVSYYEADAFAHWSGARLPTEAEWEVVAREHWDTAAAVLDLDVLHPRPVADGRTGFAGGVWEWTSSPYSPYPGFRPASGAVGEYNGKFMVNQQVLRGGCCVTPPGHLRVTYRNFYPPGVQWPFTGLRLARDAS